MPTIDISAEVGADRDETFGGLPKKAAFSIVQFNERLRERGAYQEGQLSQTAAELRCPSPVLQ